jgi:hypothetical protein
MLTRGGRANLTIKYELSASILAIVPELYVGRLKKK